MSCYYIPLFGNGDLKSDWNYAVFADGEEPAGALSEAEFAARFPDEPAAAALARGTCRPRPVRGGRHPHGAHAAATGAGGRFHAR